MAIFGLVLGYRLFTVLTLRSIIPVWLRANESQSGTLGIVTHRVSTLRSPSRTSPPKELVLAYFARAILDTRRRALEGVRRRELR